MPLEAIDLALGEEVSNNQIVSVISGFLIIWILSVFVELQSLFPLFLYRYKVQE